jgi:adenosylcobinamide-phosphate synthase
MILLTIVLALLLDQLLGELKRFHPLVGFGHLAHWVERCIRKYAVNRGTSNTGYRVAGGLGWIVLVLPLTVIIGWILNVESQFLELLFGSIILYLCIGGRSLAEHARAVVGPLSQNNIDSARKQLSRIVSRETAALDKNGIAKATVESVLENASDAILAPIFWFAIAGIPGVLLYRFSNTLDAMWGYKNQRYRYFGWAAARMDDVLNWLPARCCALSYAITGNWKLSMRCWQQQAQHCESPNAGPVMASGAGALGICLGGSARYDGLDVIRPELGEGRLAGCEDIDAALGLVWRATILWVGVIAIVQLSYIAPVFW